MGREEHDRGCTTRRVFLRTASLAVLGLALPGRAAASVEFRRLRMLNTHTGERVDVTYQEHGAYLPDALAELDRFLRDFRTGEVHPIDPGVLDLASSLASGTGRPAGTFELISGFRSALTNAMLRQHGSGVAAGSLHVQGKALDVRMPGVPSERLRDIAVELARGGVGFYERSDFVHVDTGRVRRW